MSKPPQIGDRFGRWTVIDSFLAPYGKKGFRERRLKCRCDCGTVAVRRVHHIKSGRSKSCGCWLAESAGNRWRTHGELCNGKKSLLYNVYAKILSRVFNKRNRSYKHYGGRGIGICEEWKNSFSAFRDWANASGYAENAGLQIDRIDNNGDYAPGNCRWVASVVNANNRRTNRHLTVDGKTMTIAEWAREAGLPYDVFYDRIRKGWDLQRAISTPIRKPQSSCGSIQQCEVL